MISFDALLEAERRRQRLQHVLPFDWQLGLTHSLQDLEDIIMPLGVTPTLQVVSPPPVRLQSRQTPPVEVGALPNINHEQRQEFIQQPSTVGIMSKRKRKRQTRHQPRRQQEAGLPLLALPVLKALGKAAVTGVAGAVAKKAFTAMKRKTMNALKRKAKRKARAGVTKASKALDQWIGRR